ncbi:plasma-membrane proton-efflux P-type ATPase [Candidatus Bathyarchaeota archaeon]|nr:plasma-membrane proton-efflux P-type ATPase [Candidatus Bathyarchaeota archaeon]
MGEKQHPHGVGDLNLDRGLSPDEIQRRLKEYGYNEVPEKKVNPLLKLAKKFWGVTPWMLEFTVAMELVLGKMIEAYVIFGLLVFNAAVSYIQEEKANSAVALLRKRLMVNARVKRDGEWGLIAARELVPGDLLRLRTGDMVPADAQVIDGHLDVDQSALTGESLTVERKEGEVLYSGSIVKGGEATGIVTMTGLKTYFGRTAELVQTARPRLHIEEMISKVVRWLLVMVAVSVAAGMGLALLRGIDPLEIAPLTVILLVSAIPVALPTMFTISMALGSLELSKKGAIVTRLDAIEDAATMDVLCADKTGTITMNRLTVADALPVGNYLKKEVILYGALASQEANQYPIDLAFISKAREIGLPLDKYKQVGFVPFDPSTRRTEADLESEGRRIYAVKGAVNTIIRLCRDCNEELGRLQQEVEMLSAKGYRVLAVAEGPSGDEAELVGFAALYDKPREDSPKLISELKSLGVKVKMLTGDALPIAKEVAGQAGLGENIVKVSDLKDHIEDGATLRAIEESDGFAEIYPEDKYLIVKSLQARGHFVGMTGDGVNDAPALRQAEVGIAVSNATDIAKQASSAVLTAEGFEGIFDMVVIGRMVYQRVTSWTINKIIRTFKRVVFIVLAFVLTGKFVVSTFNMILLLFLSDYVTLSISTDKVRYSKSPERWNATALVKLGVLYGSMIVAESLLILYLGMNYFSLGDDLETLRTFIFVWLTLSGYFTVLSVRERRHFWDSRPSKWLAIALVVNTAVVYLISTIGLPGLAPISPAMYLFIFAYGLVTCLLVNDLVKVPLAEDLNVAL